MPARQVLQAVDRGLSKSEAARTFVVSRTSVKCAVRPADNEVPHFDDLPEVYPETRCHRR
jgi:hypothetical protein